MNYLRILSAIAAGITLSAMAENIPNPVIPNVYDIGVMKYNGKYYLGGCGTYGDFYVSSDLVHWDGPIHVIDMENDWSKGSGCGNNQIHSNDMHYDNGTFHAYWSVNYWGRDLHAVHVVHSEASNPMGPYAEPVKDRWMDNRIDPMIFRDDDGSMYMYTVRFTDGNTIWARKMKNWREFNTSDPDQFVCQFSSNPGTWERMDNAVAEGPWVIKYHGQYYMMYNCNHTGGEYGNYQLGVAQARSPMGFNNGNKYPHPVVVPNGYALEDDNIALLQLNSDSISCTFNVPDAAHNLALRVKASGPTTIDINGATVFSSDKADYRIVNLTSELKKLIKSGENKLVVMGANGKPAKVDVFDMGDKTAEPEILWTPGQPNILRGPNGFEWWLIYMANINGGARHQYIDRVHFHGDKLVVDGISHPNNGGYHPVPALPIYSDSLKVVESAEILPKKLAAQSYLWEVNVKPDDSAGVYAIWIDDDNYVQIIFNKSTSTWDVVETLKGQPKTIASSKLRDEFKWGVYHQIRVERDCDILDVSIDEMHAATPFHSSLEAAAVPGMVAYNAPAEFAGITYTIGFDDGDNRMVGWTSPESVFPARAAIKGTHAKNYEFTTQISGLGADAVAGFYPLYVDDKNYVIATLDATKETLDIDVVRNGKSIESKTLTVDCMKKVYPDMRFSDSYDKGYTLDCFTRFDAIYLKRRDAENMFTLLQPATMNTDGSWNTIATDSASVATNPAYDVIDFAPRTARQMRFINTNPTDGAWHINDIRIHERFKDSYNLRAVREGNELRIFLDGREMARLSVPKFAPSIIGLHTHKGTPQHHNILYYHK